MYRLLIVDDEIDVAEYFYRVFTQEADLPLEVYTVNSAHDALECLDRIRIDIVLSDIKMPKMSGMQMYEIIKSKWSRCKVIFLSGVLEFDYVYKSIQNRDVRYLTKLEPTSKIIHTVKEVIDEIEHEYKEKNAIQKAQQQIEQAVPLLQNQYLYKILNNTYDQQEDVQQRLNELSIPLNINESLMLVGGLFDDIPNEMNASELEKKIYYFKSISSDYFLENYKGTCYISEQKYFIWLLQPKEDSQCKYQQDLSTEVRLNGQLEYIQGACQQSLGITISFVYSSRQIAFNSIWNEFANIKRALGNKPILTTTSTSMIVSTREDDLPKALIVDEPEVVSSCRKLVKLNMLEGFLELSQEKEFFALLSSIIDCLKKVKSRNYGPALEIYYSVATMFMKHINTYNLTERLAFKIELHKLMRVDEHDSWESAIDYLYALAKKIFETRYNNTDRFITDAVMQAQKYISDNLEKDLTLITLANMVKLNPSYFSRLFKEKTNKNLYDYVLEMRMSKAKELLRKSSEKIQDIACLVGYESAQSFTRVFRKYAGKAPTEYREV